MRAAFFGGTFDPVHRGHLAIARAAAEQFGLDEILFAPVGRQPLKAKTAEASFADRVAMVRIACATAQRAVRLKVAEIDAPNPDGSANYTVDTLEKLTRTRPEAELYAIAGADSFLTIRSWRAPERLLHLAQWIVISRPGFRIDDDALTSVGLTAEQRRRVHVLSNVHEEISASELRDRLHAAEDCREWIPHPVLDYIRANGLYGGHARG